MAAYGRLWPPMTAYGKTVPVSICSLHEPLHIALTVCHFRIFFFFTSVMAPKKNHSSARTTSEWVLWAKAEGFEDIEEHCGGVTQPGKVWFFFCMGNQDVVVSLYQVYCTLCCVWISTTANSIKQHCVEYQVGSGETRKMVQSKHAQKVAKREERRKSIIIFKGIRVSIQMCDRLNTSDSTLQALAFAYCNKGMWD